MPSPRLRDASTQKLAYIHAVRAELNRKRYLQALQLDPEQDAVFKQLRAASLAIDPGNAASNAANQS